MMRIEKATTQDAKTLAVISQQAFDDDARYGAPGPGGPPGYKSAQWQAKMMRIGMYYNILRDDRIVGGAIIFQQKPRQYELGRMFIQPAFQNQGIGAQVFALLWMAFPDATRWTLETPVWNQRTRHFYRKAGFVEIGENADQIRFEKVIGANCIRT